MESRFRSGSVGGGSGGGVVVIAGERDEEELWMEVERRAAPAHKRN